MVSRRQRTGSAGAEDAGALTGASARPAPGVIGSERTTTPRCASASSTALATAAGPGIAPPSPTPLAPSGVTGEGCSSRSTSMRGTSTAVGLR